MTTMHEQIQKSRIGRLLVNKGYISEAQLDEALLAQAKDGVLLGEALIAQGLISTKDLARVLRQQKGYRRTAAAVTMIIAPLQPMVAAAASPVAMPLTNSSNRVELSVSELGSFAGMELMEDEELAAVNAQGFVTPFGMSLGQNADAIAAGLHHKYREDEDYDYDEQNDEQVAYELADTVLTMVGLGPITNLLEADVSVEGVHYRSENPMMEITSDGRMKFYMPTEIERFSMEDIRVKGNFDGPTLGSIYMSDIRFGAGSSYTIGAK